jgi:hypothetical protein
VSASAYATAVHANGSKVVVLSVPVSPMNIGAHPAAIAAIHAAPPRPPRSRVNATVSQTSPPAARTAGSRSSHVCAPSAYVPAASSGTNGGWSTYPNAGWRPHTMKYSSSRKTS